MLLAGSLGDLGVLLHEAHGQADLIAVVDEVALALALLVGVDDPRQLEALPGFVGHLPAALFDGQLRVGGDLVGGAQVVSAAGRQGESVLRRSKRSSSNTL